MGASGCRYPDESEAAFQKGLLWRCKRALTPPIISAWLHGNSYNLVIGQASIARGPPQPCLALHSLRNCLNKDNASAARGCFGKHNSNQFFNRWFYSQLAQRDAIQLLDDVIIKGERGMTSRCQALVFPVGVVLNAQTLSVWLRLSEHLVPVERGGPLEKKQKTATASGMGQTSAVVRKYNKNNLLPTGHNFLRGMCRYPPDAVRHRVD